MSSRCAPTHGQPAPADDVAQAYKLGDPRKSDITLGPVISQASASNVRKHIDDALSKGAKALVPTESFASADDGSNTFVTPQVLTGVNHDMLVMSEETL